MDINKDIEIEAKNFLKEYEKLCQKYGMGFTGCGCCGSPNLDIWRENKWIDQICYVNYSEKTNDIRIENETIDEYFEKEEK